jgi:hypothetical protein
MLTNYYHLGIWKHAFMHNQQILPKNIDSLLNFLFIYIDIDNLINIQITNQHW